MSETTRIAVFGSSQPLPDSGQYEEARAVGRAIAEAGWTVVSGGYRGVMEAASLGAKEAGGNTIGVTTAFFAGRGIEPNRWVDEVRETETYADRLVTLMTISDAYVVMRGGSGTLSELFLTWELVKNTSLPLRPIILMGSHWQRIMDTLAAELAGELSFDRYRDLLTHTVEPGKVVPLIRERLRSVR